MLSRLDVTFLPRSKRLLISWLQSPSAVILEPPKIKSATVSPSICHEVMGLDTMILGLLLTKRKPEGGRKKVLEEQVYLWLMQVDTWQKRMQYCK